MSGLPPDVAARFAALRALAGLPAHVPEASPLETFRQQVREFYAYDERDVPVLLGGFTYLEALLSLCADIIAAAPADGTALLEAFIRDYPGAPGSNLAYAPE